MPRRVRDLIFLVTPRAKVAVKMWKSGCWVEIKNVIQFFLFIFNYWAWMKAAVDANRMNRWTKGQFELIRGWTVESLDCASQRALQLPDSCELRRQFRSVWLGKKPFGRWNNSDGVKSILSFNAAAKSAQLAAGRQKVRNGSYRRCKVADWKWWREGAKRGKKCNRATFAEKEIEKYTLGSCSVGSGDNAGEDNYDESLDFGFESARLSSDVSRWRCRLQTVLIFRRYRFHPPARLLFAVAIFHICSERKAILQHSLLLYREEQLQGSGSALFFIFWVGGNSVK